MQDLSRYRKKDTIEIHSRYISPLVVGSIVIVGLVFSVGVLVGSRGRVDESGPCKETDILARLNQQVGEPEPPAQVDPTSYHVKLSQELPRVPVPASLKIDADGETEGYGTEEEELQAVPLVAPQADEEPVPEKVREDEQGVFTLQVGSFQDQREASVLVDRLKRAGHRSFLVRVNMQDRGGVWYRVRVGPFSSKKEAWTYKDDFESRERLPAFVVKRRG